MHTRTRGLLAGLLVVGAALAPASSAAAAASLVDSRPLASISVGNLILEPTNRGYAGTLSATVTWNGPEATWMNVTIVEPVIGAWQNMANGDGCFWNETADGRRVNECGVSLQPGETKDITQSFRVLTTPRAYAMSAPSSTIWATQNQTAISKVKKYSTTFRGTNGSLKNPTPYVQDTLSNASITISGSATMVQQEGGYFLGRVPVTVQWNGDAPHWYLNIDAALPSGWFLWDTDPTSGLPCAGGCSVPGNGGTQLMQGETSSFDLIIYAPEGTQPGSYGPFTAQIGAVWTDGFLTDVTPADNSATFTATL